MYWVFNIVLQLQSVLVDEEYKSDHPKQTVVEANLTLSVESANFSHRSTHLFTEDTYYEVFRWPLEELFDPEKDFLSTILWLFKLKEL
uniref:Uncharacterized protein n=1 Tax=Panagrolaimus superbus TaxID=310955 RepID=A0A914Z8R3_9BILA